MADYQEIIKNFNNCEVRDKKIIVKSDLASFVDLVKNCYGYDILKAVGYAL